MSEVVPVTPLTYVEDVWTVAHPEASRTVRQRENGPYLRPTVPAIAHLVLDLPGAVAASVDEATQELSRFDTYATTRLGDGELAPMSAILLRTESASSSHIEQITAGARQIALAELGESTAENANLIVRNTHAMEAALALADDLDETGILQLHSELLADKPEWAGQYRASLVWVGGSKYGPRGASHVGPSHDDVPALMSDLVTFLRRSDLPPLVQAAIAHAQLETIHPFSDGNGRAGRALVHAVLRHSGIVARATAPVSAGLLRDTEGYFDALTSYRAGDAAPIIETFAAASRFAARSGVELVDELHTQVLLSAESLEGIRSDAAAHRVIPLLVGQPIVTVKFLRDALRLPERAAFRAVETLMERGVLQERSGRARGRVYQHAGILGVLDDYAAELRRR
ncbi:Fic family protein [Microbacteriaceae bacterium SG_E_30_P1]|uniref:Fic family protein n=1 Tax=Antiquaquibacter oligotrophicus TaxID=2880260 RepID=A0ABT6KTQ4_9MICO|nr:Fic family protein [Antiquaquibacter oligotrophicus]MDH6182574.1 Fic family protein [Antiquaquibacter oligotrophicus]UDF14459.1 Fic family protein [Antiquaquibacter oligotrophicus]